MTKTTEAVMNERMVLMNPGPVVVDERVRQALAGPDLCHREPEFSELMTRVREKVTRVCGGDESSTSVIFTGSGTAALEATLASVVPPGGKLLVLDNGHYGERLAQIARVHRLAHDTLRFGWAVPFDIAALERALESDSAVTHVAMVHHETSTGMLNPARETAAVVARHGRSLMVDAISSLGGELLDVCRDRIDWCVGTANKCIEGLPGLSFVCAPRVKLDALASLPARSFYLNLYAQYVAEDRAQAPPFTPAVQIFYALDAALDLMLAEGVECRTARYRRLAGQLRDGLTRLGLKLLLAPEHRCGTLTAVHFPEGVGYEALHDALKAQGFVIYAGQETLKNKVFRLANMGQITPEDIDRFLEALEKALSAASGRGGASR